ncbi:nucleotidyltransferase family protein [Kaistia adipata]|uniref:nucleotidyltransferase family protein n=1 Tax=Kaistia adipata TaxID=166954 RepID=UPI00041AC1CD|nr:nucleotidyltransferase family protein [Kaistia adipata]
MAKRPRSWPKGVVDLLVRTALCPAPEAARAWQAWNETRDFDDITWDEMRLLVPVAARLAELDPASPLRPRIDGLAKHLWTRTQLKLHEAAHALGCLNQAGVPFLVFKGGAQYAEGLAISPRRVMGDIDILIRLDDAGRTLDALKLGEWLPVSGDSFAFLRRLAAARLRGNFRKGPNGEIDLHVTPFHFSRDAERLDAALWSRAQTARLALHPVLVPDPTDSMLLLLAHAAEGTGGDWAIDAATRIERQKIDWNRLAETADERGLVPACRAGLGYLSEGLGVPVPAHVTADLASLRASPAERLKYWSNVHHPSERDWIEKSANRLADRILRRRGFQLELKDEHVILIRRAARPLGAWFYRDRSGGRKATSAATLEDHRTLASVREGAQLVIELELAPPAKLRRFLFEVCIDGVAIARLRTRAGGGKSNGPVLRLFRLPLPKGATGDLRLSLSARPLRRPRPRASAADIADTEALPFRVVGIRAA